MERSSPRSFRRRKEARPAEILEAALAVFAQKGYAAARMDEIAARAGVTKGTIYLYFKSKDEVFKTLVRESIGTQLAEIEARVRAFDGTTRDLLRFMLTTIGQFIVTSERIVLPKIILAESGNFPDLAHFYRQEVVDRGLGLFAYVMARGMARGEFRDIEPQYLARLAIAPMLLAGLWRATFAKFDATPFDYQAFVAAHIDILLNGILRKDPAP